MSEDSQFERNQIKTRLAKVESETQDAISALLDRQFQIAELAKSLATVGSQIQDLISSLPSD